MSAFDLFALPFDIVYLILDEFGPEEYGVLALTNKNVRLCCVHWYLKVIRPRHLRHVPFEFNSTPFTKFILTQHRCSVCGKSCWHGRHYLCIHRVLYIRVMKKLLRVTDAIRNALDTDVTTNHRLMHEEILGYVDMDRDDEVKLCTICSINFGRYDNETTMYWYVAHTEIRFFNYIAITTSIDDRVAAFKAAGLLHE